MSQILRRLVGLLAVLCFLWVLRPLVAELGNLGGRVRPLHLALAVLGCSLLYTALCSFLVLAWRRLVAAFEGAPSWGDSWWCIGRSQWAKYLPSNAMHLVGRQLLGRSIGLRQSSLALVSVLEHASLLGAALLLALVFGRAAGWTEHLWIPWPALVGLLALGLFGWPIGVPWLRHSRVPEAIRRHVPSITTAENARALLASLPLHSVFFLGSALLAALLYRIGWETSGAFLLQSQGPVGSGSIDPMVELLWVVPAAWIVGTLALGAPAGIGVREAIFVLGLGPTLGAAEAAGLALAFRGVTVLGDAWMALSAPRRGEVASRNP